MKGKTHYQTTPAFAWTGSDYQLAQQRAGGSEGDDLSPAAPDPNEWESVAEREARLERDAEHVRHQRRRRDRETHQRIDTRPSAAFAAYLRDAADTEQSDREHIAARQRARGAL